MENNSYKEGEHDWHIFFNNTELTLRKRTKADVLHIASFFGYKKPKWWQFWKKKIVMIKA